MKNVIEVRKAVCKDCHRCLRECEVSAIGFEDNQAWIIEEKCIYCGNCVKVCPQGAKRPVFPQKKLAAYLSSESKLAVSLAPSFISAFPGIEPGKIISGLRKLGFDFIGETASAASDVVKEFNNLLSNRDIPLISSCCPSLVNLIEKHYPELLDCLAPVVSPMILHANQLKKQLVGDWKVIFIGPCLAKQDEMLKIENKQKRPDLVLTFEQLKTLFQENNINLAALEIEEMDQPCSVEIANYALTGGALKAAGFFEREKNDSKTVYSVSGQQDILAFLEDIKNERVNADFVEMLACQGGCINGPGLKNNYSIPARKKMINDYMKDKYTNDLDFSDPILSKKQVHQNRKKLFSLPTENEIRKILKEIGKYTTEDETNCGGCGYNSCREKAIAVYQGLAEKKMCIPYMKARAESLSHIIVESSHNAIIVVNDDMIVQKFNPVAEKLFNMSSTRTKGKNLNKFLDITSFQQVWRQRKSIIHQIATYNEGELVVDQTIFVVEEHHVIVGILTDVTEQEKQKKHFKEMKKMAAAKANDVVHKQMKIVQEIAGLLGETTVETKAALYELTDLIKAGE